MQWHPLFAKMLRPLVQEHFAIETNVPVGDAPRSADIVLLRRTDTGPLPYRGLLRHLTTWNILEFKGRSVSPRVRDLDLLVELGLGLDRRLNEERIRHKQRPLDPAEASFWYIVNHFGDRFLRDARRRLGDIGETGPGIWRGQVLLRPIFLIDSMTVPVERESVPLHLAAEESPQTEQTLARVIAREPGYWDLFGPLLSMLHPNVWKEARHMARTKKNELNLRPFMEELGLEKFVSMFEAHEMIDAYGVKKLVKAIGIKGFLNNLSPEDRQKLKDELK